MKLGRLAFQALRNNTTLVAGSVAAYAKKHALLDSIFVAEIDPRLADTASFCEKYGIDQAISANCLVIEAKRADNVRYAACLILATDMADVNGAIRKQLNARKTSFAPMETALALTGMEYGGITPVGLPVDWPVLVDEAVMEREVVIIGGGVRGSKIAVATGVLGSLPGVVILDLKKARRT